MLHCRSCGNWVAQLSDQISINESVTHAFANPNGRVFEISCFSQAPGCLPASLTSSEFSWFRGYEWQVGVCNRCGHHLGWIFLNSDHRFFGLIIDHIK